MKYERVEEGVMVMKDGKAWGCLYEDGRSTEYGWMGPAGKKVILSDGEFVTAPTDFTYASSHYFNELKTGKIVKVKRITIVETEDD